VEHVMFLSRGLPLAMSWRWPESQRSAFWFNC
jgi:hypothetical protein